MRHRWGAVLDNDPFYNLNFDRKDHTFELARPPYREKPWRSPGRSMHGSGLAPVPGEAIEQDP